TYLPLRPPCRGLCMRRLFLAMALLLISTQSAPAQPAPAQPAPAQPAAAQNAGDFFEKSVRPVLATHCFECHGQAKQKAGLRLDSRAAILAGGETGPAIVPGKPQESLLVKAIHYKDE